MTLAQRLVSPFGADIIAGLACALRMPCQTGLRQVECMQYGARDGMNSGVRGVVTPLHRLQRTQSDMANVSTDGVTNGLWNPDRCDVNDFIANAIPLICIGKFGPYSYRWASSSGTSNRPVLAVKRSLYTMWESGIKGRSWSPKMTFSPASRSPGRDSSS